MYDVNLTSTGAGAGSFVVHFHVEARRADVNSPNASRAQLKPDRYSDEHYTTPDMLRHIKRLIQLRPP